MRIIYLILKIAILVLLLAFTMINMNRVQFFWAPGKSVEWPLVVFIFIAFVIGAVFGMLAMSGKIFNLKNQVRKSKGEVKKLNKELKATSEELSEKNTFINETVNKKPVVEDGEFQGDAIAVKKEKEELPQ